MVRFDNWPKIGYINIPQVKLLRQRNKYGSKTLTCLNISILSSLMLGCICKSEKRLNIALAYPMIVNAINEGLILYLEETSHFH
jgi:hypothetical protein